MNGNCGQKNGKRQEGEKKGKRDGGRERIAAKGKVQRGKERVKGKRRGLVTKRLILCAGRWSALHTAY